MIVRLDPLDRAHMSTIRLWLQDSDLRDHLGTIDAPSEPEQERWFSEVTLDRTRIVKAIVSETGEPQGLCGLTGIDLIYRRAELLLYVVGAERSGIGRAAATEMLRHAFATLGLHRVGVRVFGFNDRALAFFRSMGFVEEGVERDGVFKRGRYHDVTLLSLLAREFLVEESAIG